jgi:hypothetical protein
MLPTAHAQDEAQAMHEQMMMHHHQPMVGEDKRIDLHLTPEMKAHQLAMMRSHLETIQKIISLMANSDFMKASQIAHSQLGLTEEMKRMCMMFTKDYAELGMAFHHSGDALGDALQTGDAPKSLRALGVTLNYCVQCHAKFHD